MNDVFADRTAAGRRLAHALARRRFPDPVVLALPRGGVPVALEVALALHAPLDLLVVRKIGAAGDAELAVGAIADGAQAPVIDPDSLARTGTPAAHVARELQAQRREIARRRTLYLRDRIPLPVTGRTAIVVDDGLATGCTALDAVRALRERKPARVVLAVPVAPRAALVRLRPEVDELVCLSTPESFYAVGAHYADFRQVEDEEVTAAIARAAAGNTPTPHPVHEGPPSAPASPTPPRDLDHHQGGHT